jgi:hypothetical protein
MLLLIPIIFLAILLFYLFSMKSTKGGCRRRRRKSKECFIEYNEPTATGQLMVSDGVGNLSTFNVGTGKTLVSDGAGNITTINTGLFNNTITANRGLTGSTGTFTGALLANGGLTGTTGNFTGNIQGNKVKIQENNITFTDSNDKGLIYTNTNNTNWNGTNTPAFKPSDGMVLYGWTDGALGTKSGGDKASLKWSNDGNVSVRGTLTANEITGITDYEVFYSAGDLKTHTYSPEGKWNVKDEGDTSWDPKVRGSNRSGRAFNTPSDDADATGNNIDITIPTLQKTAYIYHLSWSSCRYFDIYGVLPTSVSSKSEEVFIKRVNAYSDKLVNSSTYHDGVSIVVVPSIDRFQKIRIKGVKGRIHYMGIGFNKTMVGSDSGFIHADNVKGRFSGEIRTNDSLVANNDLWSGQDTTRQGSTNFYNKSVNMNTHLPFTDGHNYISGLSTRIRGGDLVVEGNKQLCIGSTCLTENDLKKLKNNSFPNMIIGGRNFGSNIWVTNGGYLHNSSTFAEKNGF